MDTSLTLLDKARPKKDAMSLLILEPVVAVATAFFNLVLALLMSVNWALNRDLAMMASFLLSREAFMDISLSSEAIDRCASSKRLVEKRCREKLLGILTGMVVGEGRAFKPDAIKISTSLVTIAEIKLECFRDGIKGILL